MSLIVPYEEKFYRNGGGFIKPNGEIIFTYGSHERFSVKYCDGKDYQLLSKMKYGNDCSCPYNFDEFKKDYNFEGERDDIDVYQSSMLTKEQLELYKLWLENPEFTSRELHSDFMLYLLNWDKVQTVMKRCIVTTHPQPHVRLFNYYLMNWRIDCVPPMKFNLETGHFEEEEENENAFDDSKDREAEAEIIKIKSKTLLDERHLFFK